MDNKFQKIITKIPIFITSIYKIVLTNYIMTESAKGARILLVRSILLINEFISLRFFFEILQISTTQSFSMDYVAALAISIPKLEVKHIPKNII